MSRVKKLYASLREAVLRPTETGQLRRQVLFFVPLPIPVFAIVALAVGGSLSAPGWMILLSGSVAIASLLLAVVVQPSPLPEGLSAEASVRRSLHRFRQITTLRISLALTPIAVGAGTAVAGGGLLPLIVALLLAWPQLLLAMPSFFIITRARRAMEAWGTKAYLWAALAQSARVEWPIATYLMEQYHERKALAAQRAEKAASGRGRDEVPTQEGAEQDTSGTNADLPERLAVPTAEPKAEPGNLIPGFPMPGAVASPARRILRTGDGIRRKVRSGRGNRRPKTKN
ncbi:hypothetical protein [Allosalinactinospora lopnorensis]|uniref:hypothetical protein n=1 Tax=Allosalinactinospora lopnorensis TaxID=1352348 RepID=UPI0009E64FC0|nr:hypothetical protein [Allosalinactinospora lopnorensis]